MEYYSAIKKEVISYLGSLVQFSPAAGRAGRCRQMSLCVWGALAMFWPGSQKFWQPLPWCGAPFPPRAVQPRRPEVWRPLPGCCAPFPSAASGSGSQRFGALSTGAPRLFPPWPQRAPPVGSQEVLR